MNSIFVGSSRDFFASSSDKSRLQGMTDAREVTITILHRTDTFHKQLLCLPMANSLVYSSSAFDQQFCPLSAALLGDYLQKTCST